MKRAKPVMACWDGLPSGGPPEWPLGLCQALGDLLGDLWFTPSAGDSDFCFNGLVLRENLQETIDFPIKKKRGFPVKFPLNQSIDCWVSFYKR